MQLTEQALFLEAEVEDPVDKILGSTCNVFNDRLKNIMAGGNGINFAPLSLGMPSSALLNAGLPDLPIEMAVKRLIDKKSQRNHPFSFLSVFSLPEYIQDPIAVFNSKTFSDRFTVLTEMTDKNVNILLVIEPFKPKKGTEINDIRSIYPKDSLNIYKWIVNEGLLIHCNKNKILNWLSKQQSNSAELTKLIEDTTNIVTDWE